MAKEHRFEPFERKMQKEGLPPLVIDTFRHYYGQLVRGSSGFIRQSMLNPLTPTDLTAYNHIEKSENNLDDLNRTVVIKLNGGLGTSMRLQGAKSLIPVKNGLSFLDITALQILGMRSAYGKAVPLILMNSYNTNEESAQLLSSYRLLNGGLPFSFLQHKFPKVMRGTLAPAEYPADPKLEWNPPGHGDLYTAMVTTGLLDKLLARGFRYAFISNIDNLGATLDLKILSHFARSGSAFLMEVAERTAADRKGGHLARTTTGQLILREVAQCPPNEISAFQDVKLFGCFNTNNLWVNLPALAEVLSKGNGILGLPLIRNEKNINPLDDSSSRVYQLESAMGSAISLFPSSSALLVPRSRFVPVKKLDDLICVQSDIYELSDAYCLRQKPGREYGTPVLDLDPIYYGNIDALELRFPYGPPSLIGCGELSIRGDVRFGKSVALKGARIEIVNRLPRPVTIPDFAVVSKNIAFG